MLEWNSVMRKIFHVYTSLSFLDKLNRIVFLINSVTLAAFISAWFLLRDIDQMEWWDALPLYTMMMHATNISLILYPWDMGSTNHPIYNIQEGGEGVWCRLAGPLSGWQGPTAAVIGELM